MAEPVARAFVCGHPIAHSRSPMIHGFWLNYHGINGSYEAVDVAPTDFDAFADTIRAGRFIGGNVTIPHKEAAFRAVDWRDEAASAIGAVNTLWMEDGKLCGGNTDAYGFAANLDARSPGWNDAPRTATVLGAGGAARAILYALKQRGFTDIRIVNRTLERAEALAAEFGAGFSAHGWETMDETLCEASVLINTTSIGMRGKTENLPSLAILAPDAIVADIVYVPLETPLLAAARASGLKAVDGLGMLLHQAVPGFERWFGVRPEVTSALRELIVADIGRA